MTLTFPRADQAELARFDPNTKHCTMNCGPHRDDQRSEEERRFLCDECENVEAENAMVDTTKAENTVLTCVYCGHQYPDGTPAAKHKLLTDHIRACEKHPLRDAEQKIERLRKALVGLIGAETAGELDAMESILRSTPAPESDKIAAINAIDALRACA